MTEYTPIATIESACLVRLDFCLLATSLDTLPQSDWDFSRVSTFEPSDTANPWAYRDYDWVVVDVAHWIGSSLRCILGREGEARRPPRRSAT